MSFSKFNGVVYQCDDCKKLFGGYEAAKKHYHRGVDKKKKREADKK